MNDHIFIKACVHLLLRYCNWVLEGNLHRNFGSSSLFFFFAFFFFFPVGPPPSSSLLIPLAPILPSTLEARVLIWIRHMSKRPPRPKKHDSSLPVRHGSSSDPSSDEGKLSNVRAPASRPLSLSKRFLALSSLLELPDGVTRSWSAPEFGIHKLGQINAFVSRLLTPSCFALGRGIVCV